MAHFLTKNRLVLFINLFIFLGLNIYSCLYQKRIEKNGGRGWDGATYYYIAEQVSQNKSFSTTSKPFVFRPFVSILVGKTWAGKDLIDGFLFWNIVFNLLNVMLLFYWVSLFISKMWVQILAVSLFQLHWLFPIRYIWFYPTYIDPASFLISMLMLIFSYHAVRNSRYIIPLVLIALLSAGIRENALTAVMAGLFQLPNMQVTLKGFSYLKESVLSFAHNISKLAAPIILGACAVFCVQQVVTSDPFYYRGALLYSVKHWEFKTWLHSFFIAYGPVVIFLLWAWRPVLAVCFRHPILPAFIVGNALLSVGGGVDFERFFSWSAPSFLVLISLAIEHIVVTKKKSWWVIVPIGFCQLFAMRLFWMIPPGVPACNAEKPATVFLTRIGKCVSDADLYASHGRTVRQEMFTQYLWVVAALALLIILYEVFAMQRPILTRSRQEE